MVQLVTRANRQHHEHLLRAMHVDRKRIFVDWLKWDVPHANGMESDQFDDQDAEYLILQENGRHLGSVRLLRTDRPHLLSDVFPFLCDGDVPTGPRIREITRLCVSPDCEPDMRRPVMRGLLTAMSEYALMMGIDSYTLVTDIGFLQRVLASGWRCEMLGMPTAYAGQMIAAMRAHVDPNILEVLRGRGIYNAPRLVIAEAPAQMAMERAA